MDGDYPDLKNLVQLKNIFPFLLILDEAHGTGVLVKMGVVWLKKWVFYQK
ncbi:MAG: hypothetical protein CM1200mP16_09660 [Nitrospina sp.]|nr:MAG: hypothetical protein CM1200mP16_09660 [Nitrospina sp.]